ncbi:MAG: site-2 protease family protein [Actinobacteria bacterium]|nr:site-2 protease family protein [Actinomycetota bacterium]MCB9388118.1 site-2 protease family protein [Acidimicrobiia bacterium]
MQYVLAVTLFFGVMIFLHELGHYVTARATGMKVSEFFVGFGPRLWSFRRGETEYGIKWFPVGGYVRILGMTTLDEVDPSEEDRTYRSKSLGAKVLVITAGSMVHFTLAFIAAFLLLFSAGRVTGVIPVPAQIVEGSAAQAAGLQVGDEIVAIDGNPVTEWSDVTDVVKASVDEPVDLEVDRDGQLIDLTAVPTPHVDDPSTGFLGVAPTLEKEDLGVISSFGEAIRLVPRSMGEAVTSITDIFSPRGLWRQASLTADAVSGSAEVDDPANTQRPISPVGVARVGAQAIDSGWQDLLALWFGFNIFVGVFNLVPLLPFDGGHLAIALYEAVASKLRGRKVTVDIVKLMPITVGVVSVLGLLLVSAFLLDVYNPIQDPF